MKKLEKILGILAAIATFATAAQAQSPKLEVIEESSTIGNIAEGTEIPHLRQSGTVGGVVTNGFVVSIQAKDILLSNKMNEGVAAAETVITNGVYGTKSTVSPTDFVGDKTVMWTFLFDAGANNEFNLTDARIEIEGDDAYPGGITNILKSSLSFVATNAYSLGTIGEKKDGKRIDSGTSFMVPARKIALSLFNRSFGNSATDHEAMTYFAPFPNWKFTAKVYLGNHLIAQKTLTRPVAPPPAMPRLLISKNADGGFFIQLGDTTGWPAGTKFVLQTTPLIGVAYRNTDIRLKEDAGASFTKPTGDGEMFFRLAYSPDWQ